MRKDIMVDIETLGNETGSTIIQIAAMTFDIETGVKYSDFNQIVDIEKNKTNVITGSTIKWWLDTNKDLFHQLLTTGEYSSEEVLINFRNWILEQGSKEEMYLWGNGILFDNKLIQHHLNAIGLDYPIHYKNDRDVRTLLDLASKKLNISEKEIKSRFEDDSLVAHNALDDVVYQINLVVGCYKSII